MGKNNYGQLGDGTTTSRNHPVQVTKSDGQALSGVQGIDAGGYCFTFYLEDGTFWACGKNSSGQLGDGTTTNRSRAVQLVDDSSSAFSQSDIVNWSAGGHVLYQLKDGSLWALGNNTDGQLGDGTTTSRLSPVQILRDSGISGDLGNIIATSAGTTHTVFLKNDGTVWATGGNDNGQLGDGTISDRNSSVQVMYADGSPLVDIVKISAGGRHTLYLKHDGTVLASGKNSGGQLGDGSNSNRMNPVHVKNADGSFFSGVVDIFASEYHSIYLKSDGTVWGSGSGDNGQLGNGSSTSKTNPVQVIGADGKGLTGVVEVTAGFFSFRVFEKVMVPFGLQVPIRKVN